MMRRPRTLVAALAVAGLASTAALSGCGLGAGNEAAGVHLRVSDNFGARVLAEPGTPKQAGADTVMRLLQRNTKVTTRYGGGFVQSIDGLSGLADSGKQIDWFYFVNGVLASRGAASWRVRPGERIWWDRHRWDLDSVSAVVGDFPEPMRTGHDGKWAGARLDCRGTGDLCSTITGALKDAGVRVADGAALEPGSRQTRVLAGTWDQISRASPESTQLAGGPGVSGVFAKLSNDGTVRPVSANGKPQRAGAGDGLVAAIQVADHSPLWVVTGPTPAAVAQAARALNDDALTGAFAVLTRDGRAYPLPLRRSDQGRKLQS